MDSIFVDIGKWWLVWRGRNKPTPRYNFQEKEIISAPYPRKVSSFRNATYLNLHPTHYAVAITPDGNKIALRGGYNRLPAGHHSPARPVDPAMSAFGRLDCLVNNAGSGKWAPVHATDDAMLDEVIDISLKAPFRFCRESLRVMASGSSIVNVGSTFGIVGGLDGGTYCAVKAGLIGLTQTMAAQYGANGIRSNLVAPGVIKTEMTRDHWEYPSFQRINQEMSPCDRDGTTEDVANTIFFLASREGSYINGQTIALDGGWSTPEFLGRGISMLPGLKRRAHKVVWYRHLVIQFLRCKSRVISRILCH